MRVESVIILPASSACFLSIAIWLVYGSAAEGVAASGLSVALGLPTGGAGSLLVLVAPGVSTDCLSNVAGETIRRSPILAAPGVSTGFSSNVAGETIRRSPILAASA